MSLWMYEMKKMFLLQKGLLFVGLFLVLTLASLAILDKPANPDIERNASTYLFYLNQVQGPYSEKTERFFAAEAAKISNAKVALQKASDDYYDGKMGEKEFLAVSAPLESILEKEKGFKVIYDQFTYIRENPANRYFLYTNGWEGLLANDDLDFFWLLLLLLLVAPVFGFEFESKMDALLLTVKKGTGPHTVCKIVLVLLTVAVLCLLTAGLRYGFYRFKYGLENGNYPLQSLSYFGTSTKDLTLLEAYLWITAGKLFGSLCFAVLILFVSICLKKYAVTLFLCSAALLLPYYGLRLESSKYFFPGPLGFMVSTGFLRGNESKRNPFKDQMDVVFREVSLTAWSVVFAVTLCLSIGMLIVIGIRRTNVWSARKPVQVRRASRLMLILCLAVSVLSGCTSSGSTGTSDIYNCSSRQSFENERYRFYVDDTDLENIRIVFEDKNSGEKRNFIRNPMPSLTRVENTIYGNGSRVYYMKYDFDKSGFMEKVARFSVIEVDTTTFQEKIVFEKKLSTDKSSVLGLVKVSDHDASFYMAIRSFFRDEHSLYFIGQNEIRRVNRRTGDMRVILRLPAFTNVAFDGRTIYYANEKSQVVKYDTKTGSETVIPDLITRNFVLTDTELLFMNRKDRQKMYALRLSDSSIRKIADQPARG
ncbi:ABC transporter permease [Cohnella thermotolerans]|uniref:ABC transporter permease n=1 Tax=Cohnella thermotolerans TaxID=329858 RepID=UPI0012EBDA05|nr:ABC transporter permease [Cohnella thermotolerans]